MPGRVHALLVVRPDGRAPAAFHLRRTLAAVEAQSRPVDALTIVICGDDPVIAEVAAAAAAESVITAPARTRFAEAIAIGARRVDGDAIWLLAQDTAPEREALSRLAGALELSPSVAFVAPKLVRWDDRSTIVSLGVSVTRLGRTVGLADGELDQGQHDAVEDVLGADVRGILIRSETWREIGGLDPALAGADEGLDLGVRARLAGARIALVPRALVAVAGDGVAERATPRTQRRSRPVRDRDPDRRAAPPTGVRGCRGAALPLARAAAPRRVADAGAARAQAARSHPGGVGRIRPRPRADRCGGAGPRPHPPRSPGRLVAARTPAGVGIGAAIPVGRGRHRFRSAPR